MKLAQRLAIGYIRTKFKLLSSISKKKAAEKAFELFCTPMRRNRKKPPKIFEEAETLKLKLGNDNIRGWRWNHPAEKKALIIHGFESSVINFDRYIRPLIRKGYEVLAFDAPAHGRSTGKKITAPMYADMIVEIHKNYGPIQSFMAHSFGGLAVSLALEKLDHDDSTRVVLIAPATETTTAISSFVKFLKLDKEVEMEFHKLVQKVGGVPPSWYSIKRALQNVKSQVLWFHDRDDDTTPITDAEAVRELNYRHVKFIITEGLGHRRIYRDNKVSRAITEFL